MAFNRLCWIASIASALVLVLGIYVFKLGIDSIRAHTPFAGTASLNAGPDLGGLKNNRAIPSPDTARLPEIPDSSKRSGFDSESIRERNVSWACQFGAEFWRRPSPFPIKSHNTARTHAGLVSPENLADAIERTTHAFQERPDGFYVSAEWVRYQAILSSKGIGFAPAQPPSTSGLQNPRSPELSSLVQLRTRSIQRRGFEPAVVTPSLSDWVIRGNTAQFLLEPQSGIVEHYEATRAGVELTWVLPTPPDGNGDMQIETILEGAQFSRQTASGLHFCDSQDLSRIRISPVIAKDHAGRSWPIPVELASGGLRVIVPEQVLTEAEYPLAIDPLISAEFGVDQPLDGPSLSTRSSPTVTANASGYLVAWTQGKGEATDPGVYCARLDSTGALLDPYGIEVSLLAGEQTVCAAAATADLFLLVWAAPHGSSTTDWDILGARILPDGTILDSPPLPICSLSGSIQNSPAVAADSTGFLVVWRDTRSSGIYGTLVSATGQISSTNGFPICTALNDQYTPAVASLGNDYLVAWQDYRKANLSQYYSDIFAARISGAGVLLDTNGIAVCISSNSQYHPSVAANGTNYLVVWEDYDVGGNDIVGARITPAGVMLDTNSLLIVHGPNAQVNPVVTSSSSGDFLVVWQDFRDSPTNQFSARLFGARVSDAGSIIDQGGVALTGPASVQGVPAIVGRGNEFVLAWQDSRNNPATTLADIYGCRFSGPPAVAPDFRISGTVNSEISPALAALGTNYLAVWADTRNLATTGRDIYGARLNQDGTLLAPNAFPICTATNTQGDPDVAANGTNFLVVWSDFRNSQPNATNADIFGAVVSLSGSVLPTNGFAICDLTNDQSFAAVATLATNFLVVWQDSRNSVSNSVRWDIYGTRISSSGDVLDSAGIAICTNISNQNGPAVAADPDQALVVWTDYRSGITIPHIYGARIDSAGAVLDPTGLPICVAGSQQTAPAVAANGHGYLVAWVDARNGAAFSPDIYGVKVATDGSTQPLNGFPIRVAPGVQNAPDVTFNGRDYLVTWQEGRDVLSSSFGIVGTLIDSDSARADGPLFGLSDSNYNQLAPVAASADGRFLILNQSLRAAAQRVTANLADLEAYPRLDSIVLMPSGQLQFRLRGAVGTRYGIEASDDLKAWVSVLSVTNTESALVISDAATNWPGRFYRAVLLP